MTMMVKRWVEWTRAALAFPFFFVGSLINAGLGAAIDFTVGYWYGVRHPELMEKARPHLEAIGKHIGDDDG